MRNKRASLDVKKICGIGVFSALAIIVAFATSPIKVGFLSFDAKDAVITLSAFIYGPVSGVLVAAVSALVEFFTFSSTGPYGLLMNFASSATFVLVAALVYFRKKTFNFAIIGIYAAVFSVTAVMLLLNILVTPYYMGTTMEAVASMIPTILLPFNLAKATFNGGAVLLLYKPLVRAMRRAGLVPRRESAAVSTSSISSGSDKKIGKNTLLALIIGGVSVALAVVGLVLLNLYQPWKI